MSIDLQFIVDLLADLKQKKMENYENMFLLLVTNISTISKCPGAQFNFAATLKNIYVKDQLPLKGLTIGFVSKPASADRFAAQELSGILPKLTNLAPLKQHVLLYRFYFCSSI